MTLDATLLKGSLSLVVEREPLITRRFYDILFDRHPQVRPMFSRNSLDRQQRMLQEAIVAVLDHLDDAAWLRQTLHALGARHAEYGVTPEMYSWVGACLLATLAEIAGPAWSAQIESAWSEAYGAISGMMLEGAKSASTAE